jgi:beta-fructofuranosidase/levanase/fructan beta-fructosidase
LVNSYADGDKAEGTLTSPEFEITQDHLSFLIGGGNHAGKTCLNLLVDGKVAHTATGDAAERLTWKSWDVRNLRGRKASLEIVDRHTGGWGHVNVDQILLADSPARPASQPALWADFGADFYAAVSWSDIPERDGRRLWLGWMSNWQYANDVPTSPWRSAMSLPRELSLRNTPEGLRLVQQPLRELRKLRDTGHRLSDASFREASNWLAGRNFKGALLEVEIQFATTGNAADFGIGIGNGANEETVVHRGADGKLSLDRTRSGKIDFHRTFPGIHEATLPIRNNATSLHLFLDTSSVEVFANEGEVVLTDLILPTSEARRLRLFSNGEGPRVKQIQVWELKSAWP